MKEKYSPVPAFAISAGMSELCLLVDFTDHLNQVNNA